jgi:hypothetical protein
LHKVQKGKRRDGGQDVSLWDGTVEMKRFFSVGESPADPVKGVLIRDFFSSFICNSSTSSFLFAFKGGNVGNMSVM